MQTQALQDLVVNTLEDMKAQDMNVLDVKNITSITDVMIICSGTSERHVRAMANSVVVEVKKQDIKPLGIEGETVGEWALIDLGDVIVHVMLPKIRDFYSLEKLWTAVEEIRENTSS